ncbi:MAG: fibronectin type III domain-containing protein [Patescibacteria group bacterium]
MKKLLYLTLFLLLFTPIMPITAVSEVLPDLSIDRIFIPLGNQYAGSPFNAENVQVKIINLNPQIANDVKLDLFIVNSGGTIVCQGSGIDVGQLLAWKDMTYTLDRYQFINCQGLTGEENILRAVADYENLVTEENENNNSKDISITVLDNTNAPVVSEVDASIQSLSQKETKISYKLANISDNSILEYATEEFWGEKRTYDKTITPYTVDRKNYYAVASSTDRQAYHYRVKLTDSNLQSSGQIFVLMQEDQNPGFDILKLQNLIEVKNLTDKEATISWQTNKNSSTKIYYEIDNQNVNGDDRLEKEVSDDSVREHSITLNNLTPNSHYYYKVESIIGDETVSFVSHFYTIEEIYQVNLPEISNLTLVDITQISAKVSFVTDIESQAKISYEIDNSNLDGENLKTISKTANEQSHVFELTELTSGSHYYYKVEAIANNKTGVQSGEFTTLSEPEIICLESGTAKEGDLIKMDNNSSIYYLGNDCKRYVFPNEKTYLTWYSNFSNIKILTSAEIISLSLGGNITYRPGVKMVKITTDPKVYAVEKNGVLRWIKTETIAKELYGNDWNKKIDDIPDAFFVNYTIGNPIESAGGYDKEAATAGSQTINVDKGL